MLYLHLSMFFILLLFFIHIFLFDVIHHPSVGYRRVFTSIFYFQPSPSQSVLIRDTFIFNHSVIFLPRALRLKWAPTGVFYLMLLHRHFYPALIKVSLGAGSSSLGFAEPHTDILMAQALSICLFESQ